MKTLSLSTHWHRTSALARGLALSALAASAWALSAGWSPAQARDVYWSVGIQQPGVVLGVSNAPPVVVPQYVPPPKHRVQQPPVVVYGPPVWVHAPHRSVQPVVVVPQPVYVQNWGHGPRWDERRERRHHRRHDRHERYERSDRNDRHDRNGHGEDPRRGPDRR